MDKGPGGKREGAARCGLRTAMSPISSITPLKGAQSPGERWWPLRILIWRNCQNWGQKSPVSQVVSWEYGGREQVGTLSWAPSGKVTEGGDVEGISLWNTQLVEGADDETRGGQPQKAGTGRVGLLFLLKRVSKLHQVENYQQAPLHHHVFSRRTSCHHPTLSVLVGTFGKSNARRQWHMPKPSSSGWRKLIHLLEGNHACWWVV